MNSNLLFFLLLMLLFVAPYLIVYLLKKYLKFKNKDYLNLTITLLGTFIGFFLAIQAKSYLTELEARERLLSLLQSSYTICETNTRVIKLIIESDIKEEAYFEGVQSVYGLQSNNAFRIILENGDLYKYTSDSFKSKLPFLIAQQEINPSLRFKSSIMKLDEFNGKHQLLQYEKKVLDIEIDFVNGLQLDSIKMRYAKAYQELVDYVEIKLQKNIAKRDSMMNQLKD